MGEAEKQILQMLEEGRITAEEANQLLSAIGPDQEVGEVSGEAVLKPVIDSEAGTEPPLNTDGFRNRFWRIPLLIALGSLLLSAIGLTLMYQAAGQVAFIGFLCVWSFFLLALLASVFLLLIRKAPWLHVRIQEQDGQRFAISLPLPLSLANWGIRAARYFVPQDQVAYLETAGAFIDEMKNSPEREPIIIDVDDDDGDKVQVYIG